MRLCSPMLLKDLPEDARPREKLLARGAGALSDAELLALLLRTGIPGKNALQMGQELMDTFGGVAGLLHTGPEALESIKGLGPAKRSELVAVLSWRAARWPSVSRTSRCSARRRRCGTIFSFSWAAGRTRFLPCCSWTASNG